MSIFVRVEVRKALEMQATSTGNMIEEALVGIYEENSKVIQDKLQEIFAVLDRICKFFITVNDHSRYDHRHFHYRHHHHYHHQITRITNTTMHSTIAIA